MGTVWNTILIIKEPFVVHGHPAFAVQSGPMDPVQGWIKAQVLRPAGGSRTQDELEEDLGREGDSKRFGDLPSCNGTGEAAGGKETDGSASV